MTRPSRSLFLSVALAVAAASSARAQQVVGHHCLLPAEAGMNPLGFGAIAADPANPDVFLLTGRGLTALDRGGATLVNYELGPGGASFGNDLAFDATNRRLLVADAGQNAVIVIDGASRTVLARRPLPFTPGRIAIDPSGGLAFVLSASSNQIARVDLATLAVAGPAGLAAAPSRIAVNPASGRVYVTSSAAGATWVLEPTLVLRASIATGPQSLEIAINDLSDRAYVVRTDGNVAVVDTATDSLVTTLPVSSARWVAVHRASGWAYVSSATAATFPALPESQIVAIDATDTAQPPVRLGGTPAGSAVSALAIDETSNRLFASEQVQLIRARVTAFDLTPAPTRSGAGLTGDIASAPMGWSPASGRLYLASTTGAITELEPGSFAPTRILAGAAIAGGTLDPVAGFAWVLEQGAGEAIRIDPTDPAQAPIRTPVGAIPTHAVASASRGEIYVLGQLGRSISVLDAAGGALLRTRSNVPTDLNFGFALDDAVPAGPRAVLTGFTQTILPQNPSWVQSYQPGAGDLLTPLSGILLCSNPPCIIGAGVDVDPAAHRAYLSALYWSGTTPPTSSSLAVWDPAATPAWRNIPVPDPAQLPTTLVRWDPASSQVFLPADSATQTKVVAVADGATPSVVAMPTAGAATAFEVWNGRLYVAEAGAGQIEIFDVATHGLVNPVNTGGAPVDLAVHEGAQYLFVQNDGLASPGLQVYDVSGQRMFLSDIGYFAIGGAILAGATGNVTAVDNLHGTVALVDPLANGLDFQIDPSTLPDGTTAQAYLTAFTQSGGSGPFRWEIASGRLPPGLVLDPATGTIDGTPTQEGVFSFLIKASDDGQAPPRVDVEDFQIQILDLRIVTTALPAGFCGPYSVQLLAAGGLPPYGWAATNLPAGLAIDPATGLISGALSANQSCPPLVDIEVRDSLGTLATASLCLPVVLGSGLPRVDNGLMAVRDAGDVVLAVPPPAAPAVGHNAYRSSPPLPVSWQLLGAPPSTTTGRYRDAGAVASPPSLQFYAMRSADACGGESDDPLF